MEKIAINLLPSEYKVAETQAKKFYKVQAISVAIVLLTIFLASLSIALRILQNQNIKSVQAQVSSWEERVFQLKDRQASLFVLKNRLSVIGQYLAAESVQAQTYQLLHKLLPAQVAVNSLAVDRSGIASIVVVVPDPSTLDNLISSLISGESRSISSVSIESLNRGKDGIYRLSFKVKPRQ